MLLRSLKKCSFLTLILACVFLSSCGFQAVYKENGSKGGLDALPILSSVSVEHIPERQGQQLKGFIEDLLNPTKVSAPNKYRLYIELHRELVPLVIEQNRRITRYNLVFTANFRLTDTATSATLHTNSSRMIGSFDAADSEFSVYTAEEDTAGRILKEMANDVKLKLTAYFLNSKSQSPNVVILENENTRRQN